MTFTPKFDFFVDEHGFQTGRVCNPGMPAFAPHFQCIAGLAWELFHNHMPTYTPIGGWHLPYVDTIQTGGPRVTISRPAEIGPTEIEPGRWVDMSLVQMQAVSVGRCARVSYYTHEGKRDPNEDIRLHDDLAKTATLGADPMHASPFEHQAQAIGHRQRSANFEGWKQYRAFFPRENGPDTSKRCIHCGAWGERHVVGCRNQQQAAPDHAYLSAGDNPYASGDRAYRGCSLCNRPRSEHVS